MSDNLSITINANSQDDYKIIKAPTTSFSIANNNATELIEEGYYVIQVNPGSTIRVIFNQDFNNTIINQLGYLMCAGGENGENSQANGYGPPYYTYGGSGGASIQNEFDNFYIADQPLDFTCGSSNEKSVIKYQDQSLSMVGFNTDINITPPDSISILVNNQYTGGSGAQKPQGTGGNNGINSQWIGATTNTLQQQLDNSYKVFSYLGYELYSIKQGQGGGGASGWPTSNSTYPNLMGGKGGDSGIGGTGQMGSIQGGNGSNGGGGGGGGTQNTDQSYYTAGQGGKGGQGLLNFYFYVGPIEESEKNVFIFNSTTEVNDTDRRLYTNAVYNNTPSAPLPNYITDQNGSTDSANPSKDGDDSTQKWPQNSGDNDNDPGYEAKIGGSTTQPPVNPPGYQSFGGKANIQGSNPTYSTDAYNSDTYATYTGYKTTNITIIMTGGGGGAGGPGTGKNNNRGGTGGGGGSAAQYYGTISINDNLKTDTWFQKFEIQIGGGGVGGVGGAKNTSGDGRKGLIGFDGGITACRITLNNGATITLSCNNGGGGDFGKSHDNAGEGGKGGKGAGPPTITYTGNANNYVTLNNIISVSGIDGINGEKKSKGGGQGAKLNSEWIDTWSTTDYENFKLPNFDSSSGPLSSYYYFENNKGYDDENYFIGPYYYGMGGPSCSAKEDSSAGNSYGGKGGYLYIYSSEDSASMSLTELINIPINMNLQDQKNYIINNQPEEVSIPLIATSLNANPIN